MSQTLENKNYGQLLEGFEKRTGEPDWLSKIRQQALDRFKATGFPTRKYEAWKYLYLEGVLQTSWNAAPEAFSGKNSFANSSALKQENCLVFVDGVYQPTQSQLSKTLQPLLSTQLDDKSDWVKNYLAVDAATEPNAFISANTAQFREGVFLKIPKHTIVEAPLHVIFTSQSSSPVFHPRVLIAAEEGAQINLVFHLQGNLKERYFMNATAEFVLGPQSKISTVICQQEGPDAIQFFNLKARVDENASFEVVNYTAGGSITRNEVKVELLGPQAVAAASGLSLMSGNSQAFQHVTINHQVPQGTSRQVYKNILAGKSVAEFTSMVHVWRDAKQSDSEQLDKNLLLSEDARVYSRPQLRIDNDDVKASHGAATGQLQENEVFYLRSRGLDPEQARFLLIYGFAEQVLEKIKIDWLRKELEADMETRVRQMLEDKR